MSNYRTIYFKVVTVKKRVTAELTIEQMRRIPCYEIYFNQLEELFFEIRFKPQAGVTDEQVLAEHILALKKRYRIRSYEIYDVQNDYQLKK